MAVSCIGAALLLIFTPASYRAEPTPNRHQKPRNGCNGPRCHHGSHAPPSRALSLLSGLNCETLSTSRSRQRLPPRQKTLHSGRCTTGRKNSANGSGCTAQPARAGCLPCRGKVRMGQGIHTARPHGQRDQWQVSSGHTGTNTRHGGRDQLRHSQPGEGTERMGNTGARRKSPG